MRFNLKSIFKRIKQSEDGRTLVSNFSYLSLLQIAGYVFPIITLPYLARVIGADGFGKIAFASAIIIWFQTIADWGFNYTATRDVARCRDDIEKVSEIFSNVLWARCVLVIASIIILSVCIILIPVFRNSADVIFVTALMLPGHIMFPDWFFQAIEKMKYTTLLNLLSKLIFTTLIFVFIKKKDDYILQPLFISLGFIFSGIIAMYFILGRWHIKLHRPDLRKIAKTIRGSTDIFLYNIVQNLYNSVSVVFLGTWHGSYATGIYDAGKKFKDMFENFLLIISRTFFPFLSRKGEKHGLFAKIYLACSSGISLLLFVFAPIIIRIFYGKEFDDSVVVLRIVSIAIVPLGLSTVYGVQWLLQRGYERQMRRITIIVSLLGFAMAIPMVYFFSYLGVAIVYILTNTIQGISYYISVKRLKATI
ncbi:MAG: flippase [Candidatus Egerieousia sp.]